MELQMGNKIALYRKNKGYTQEQLGEMVGVSGQAVSKWEKGGLPDTYLLPAIARALGISVDALFACEGKSSSPTQEEMLDALYSFCMQRNQEDGEQFDLIGFLFEAVWAIQSAYFGQERRTSLREARERNQGNPQVTSQVILNSGTTYLTLMKDFPFFCMVGDTPELSQKIWSEQHFGDLFSLLASEDGFKAMMATQTATEASQYTEEMMAEKMGISLESFLKLAPRLVKYGLLHEDSLALEGRVTKVYHKWSCAEVRPLLMLAKQLLDARQCYDHFACNRTKAYFEKEPSKGNP